MKKIWFILYNIVFIPSFWTLLQIAALFNTKIRRGIDGRKGLFEKIHIETAHMVSFVVDGRVRTGKTYYCGTTEEIP